MTKTKIFVTYKNRHKIIKSDIITPIQTGRAISDEIFKDMLGDNTGDNISDRNEKFNELSAIYWAWKNYKKIKTPDYIGFMHYRRHFIFNPELNKEPNLLACTEFLDINNQYIKEIMLDSKSIKNCIKGYDCIIPNKTNIEKITQDRNIQIKDFSRWAFSVIDTIYTKDFDLMLDVVIEKFPEYSNAVEKFQKINYNYWYNSFIMKKELFFRYCEFLFTIQFELEKRIDMTNYNNIQIRTLGYLGERLFTIFVLKLEEENLKIKEIPISFVSYTGCNFVGNSTKCMIFLKLIKYYLKSYLKFSKNKRKHYKNKYLIEKTKFMNSKSCYKII